MSVELRGWEKFNKALKKFAEKFEREINESIGEHIVSKAVGRIKKGEIKPPTSEFTLSLRRGNKGKTLLDKGHLWQSLTYKVEGNSVKVGSKLRYAKIHQFGGVIKPKEAKTLCIPATKLAKRLSETKGVKGALEELKSNGWHIWFEPNAIMGRKGKRGKEQVLFYRKKKVKIPARTYVYLNEKDWEEITQMVEGWIK
jgi:phage gpG-like protein